MMKETGVSIVVDDREAAAGVVPMLEGRDGVSIEITSLPAGDYRINGRIFVERKTTRDFIECIISGRLFRQASFLRAHTGMAFMIVEGDDLFRTGLKMNPRAVRGAVVSLALSWRVPVLFARDREETVDLLLLSAFQDLEFMSEYGGRLDRKPKKPDRLKMYVLQGLPGVGRNRAEKLLRHFGSVESVICAGEEALREVEGIGRARASRIRRVAAEKVEKAQAELKF